MSLLSIEISARFHRNRATFHNSLNCEMEWWMDGWMLTMMFLFQAITFRYWLIWTDFWFKYCFSRSNPILNIHPSLTLPLVVCLYPLQLNVPPPHWLFAYILFCKVFTPHPSSIIVCKHPLQLNIHPSFPLPLRVSRYLLQLNIKSRVYIVPKMLALGQIHFGASGRWPVWDEYT